MKKIRDFIYDYNDIFVALLIIAVAFIATGIALDNAFFTNYTGILVSTLPITLLSYDERSHFDKYSATLPVSRSQYVSAKYLIGLLALLCAMIVLAAALAVKSAADGSFSPGGLAARMMAFLSFSLVVPALDLPFIFRFGVEKGRIAYLIILIACAGLLAAVPFLSSSDPAEADTLGYEALYTAKGFLLPALCLLAVALYTGSWALSAALYKKREL